MARARCKVKCFHIYIDGKFVSNSFGENTTQAIALYCKQFGIATKGVLMGCILVEVLQNVGGYVQYLLVWV